MLANIDTVHNYSIKHFLLSLLQASVGFYRGSLEISAHQAEEKPSAEILDFNSENIPLNLAIDNTRILYVSAIAFKLAAVFKQPPVTIATELCRYLSSKQILPMHYYDAHLQSYTVEVVPPGWLHFQLTGLGVTVWLQHLLGLEARGAGEAEEAEGENTIFTRHPKPDTLNPTPIFKLQYVHARCCSLLRLGQREGLIKLGESPGLQLLEPQPIPWLNSAGEFHLIDLAEWQLIAEIFGLIDDINGSNQNHWLKLVDTFEKFYSKCRIFGEVKRHQPQLAQARLGLVAAARSVLQLVLRKRLGILPLLEL